MSKFLSSRPQDQGSASQYIAGLLILVEVCLALKYGEGFSFLPKKSTLPPLKRKKPSTQQTTKKARKEEIESDSN